MNTVLITAIGGDIAQSVARLVRRAFPEFRLIGTDIATEHGGSLFVDELLQVPVASDQGYVEALTGIIKKERVSHVIPMAEAELAVLLPLIRAQQHARWITAGAAVIEAGIDKLETMRALERMDVPVPWTIPVDQAPPRGLPCILKDRAGSGSRGVYIVGDPEEARYLAARHPSAVFQELLLPADQEVTCAVYRTADDRVATLQMRRRLIGGFTGWAIIIDEPAIAAVCEKIARQLDLRGAMNVQLRLTRDGPRVFEINPRYSSTVLMRHEIGFTDVVWAFDELRGRRVEFPQIPLGTILVRTQDAAAIAPQRTSRMRTAG
jgi:carbamoyl-phosphate synthase large subunit